MASKKIEDIRDLLILRNTFLYQYVHGINKYSEALKKIKELETQLINLSGTSVNDGEWISLTVSKFRFSNALIKIANCTSQ